MKTTFLALALAAASLPLSFAGQATAPASGSKTAATEKKTTKKKSHKKAPKKATPAAGVQK